MAAMFDPPVFNPTDDDLLGEGAYGKVYRNGTVAMKRITMSTYDIDSSIINELHAYARVQGFPGISWIIDTHAVKVHHELKITFTMPLADGTLNELVHFDKACVFKQSLQAVQFIHSRGVVHADIKPSNILLKDGHVLLTDFGISILDASYINDDPDYVVSMWYKCPELLCKRFPRRIEHIDAWALAVVAWEVLNPETRGTFSKGDTHHEVWMKVVDRVHTLKQTPFGAFLSSVLTMNERERLSVSDLLQHPYFTTIPDKVPCSKVTMPLLVTPISPVHTLADLETAYSAITCKAI
jgi:serine/threonine protein kinase